MSAILESIDTTEAMEAAARESSHGGRTFRQSSQKVDEAAVMALFGGAPGTANLAGNGFTYRHDWGNKNGWWKLNLAWGAVNARSRVFVALAEGAAGGPDGGKFIGAARYTLYNVAPHANGVGIWIHIDWGYPIRCYVDYLVVNP